MAAQSLIGPAIKALASGAGKKAVAGAAKNFVSGKNRKGKEGSSVKSGKDYEKQVDGGRGSAIVPITPIVGSYRVETISDKPNEVGKPSKVNYETINNQLDSIIGLTNVLKKTSAAKLKNAETKRKAQRKAAEIAKKRQRESLLEKGAGKAVGMVSDLDKDTEGFDPLKFFTMIGLGNLIKWFNEQGSKISAPLRAGLAALNNVLKAIKAGLRFLGSAFKGGLKLIGKLPGAILRLGKSIGKTIFRVGKGLGSVFLKLGKRLFKFVKGLLGRLKIPKLPRIPTPKPKGKGPTPKGKGPTPKGGPKGGPQIKSNPKINNKLKKMGLTDNQVDVYNKARQGGAGATDALKQAKATPPQAPKAPKVKPKPLTSVNKFLKTLFGITDPKDVKKLSDASPVLKKGGNFMKGARIPVVGPMIVFALTALDPNPETGGIGRAAFKAIGTGLGEFLGFAIPIPVLGPIIGGLVGEVMGDAAYELIINKNSAAAGKKIMDAVKATGDFFGPILDWAKGVVSKFFDSLPKINIFGFGEVINPLALVPPMLLTEVPKALMNAFFGEKDEEVEKVKVDEETKPDPKKMLSETEFHNAKVEDHSLPDTYEEYKQQHMGLKPSDMEGGEVLKPKEDNQDTTPAQVLPSTESQDQMSNEITGLSQQLSYEQTGNTVVMVQGPNGQQTPMISGGSKGTPIIMGSGDVVNSYYKSQVLGSLYKQG